MLTVQAFLCCCIQVIKTSTNETKRHYTIVSQLQLLGGYTVIWYVKYNYFVYKKFVYKILYPSGDYEIKIVSIAKLFTVATS